MSKARQLADLLDTGGDVLASALDNSMPSFDWNNTLNKPSFAPSATTNTTNAGNVSTGTLSNARLATSGSPSSSTYLRGDGSWQTNCTNHPNCNACVVPNCYCACACNC